jgi:hypothetical protein
MRCNTSIGYTNAIAKDERRGHWKSLFRENFEKLGEDERSRSSAIQGAAVSKPPISKQKGALESALLG